MLFKKGEELLLREREVPTTGLCQPLKLARLESSRHLAWQT